MLPYQAVNLFISALKLVFSTGAYGDFWAGFNFQPCQLLFGIIYVIQKLQSEFSTHTS